jgi:hypothetical protein
MRACLFMFLSSSLALPAMDLNLENHAFASFGWFRTTGNNWVAPDSRDGSTDLWEAAANAISRPNDYLRLGGQLFVRDWGNVETPRARVDWLYGDARLRDWLGIQAGRVKIPVGLYNEALDVDASHTSIFPMPSVYAIRSRDLFLSVDGAKTYGLVALDGAGSLEYTVFGGQSDVRTDGGWANNFVYLSQQSAPGANWQVTEVGSDLTWGGMLHWNTPCSGLGLRLTAAATEQMEATLEDPALSLMTETESKRLWYAVASVEYETGIATYATEIVAGGGAFETRATAGGALLSETTNPLRFAGGYAGAIWHLPHHFSANTAYDLQLGDYRNPGYNRAQRLILGLRYDLTEHWLIKAEWHGVQGTYGVFDVDNPNGTDDYWQMFALKTTVDF